MGAKRKTNATPNLPSETCSEEEEEVRRLIGYQDGGEVGGEGGLVLKKVAVSVQCCTAFKHLLAQSGTD